MERFELRHTVHRSLRRTSIDVTDHAALDDAHRVADLEAAFTTVNDWRQDLVDGETGQSWVRTTDNGWVAVGA